MTHCAHTRLKNLTGYTWCRDCGALRALEEGGRWVRPGRVWRTPRSTKPQKPKSTQLTLPET